MFFVQHFLHFIVKGQQPAKPCQAGEWNEINENIWKINKKKNFQKSNIQAKDENQKHFTAAAAATVKLTKNMTKSLNETMVTICFDFGYKQ